MNRLRTRLLAPALAVICALGLLAPAAAPVRAQTKESVEAQIAALDRQLSGVAKRRAATRERVDELTAERTDVEARRKAALETRDASAAAIQEWAVIAYKTGGDGYLGAWLGGENLRQANARVNYIQKISDKARVTGRAAEVAQADAAAAVARLDELAKAEQASLRKLERESAQLAVAQAKQQEILASIPPPPPPPPPTAAPTRASGSSGGSGGGGSSQPQPTGPTGSAKGAVFEVTCYSDGGTTASGVPVGPGVAATDWRVIPKGTSFRIDGLGTYTAYDTGGAVKGNIIDIWNPSNAWCLAFGRQRRQVEIIG